MTTRTFTLFATIVASILGSVESAHSRRRPIRRLEFEPRYDRSITTFDSDGRMRQVEYGMEASRRGDSIAAMVVPSMNAAFLAVDSSDKVHRIDAHILLITAGLAGDGRALASALREFCQRFRLSFGEAPTVEEAAIFAAGIQHDLTRTAGARPLGCTAIVAGFDLSMLHEEILPPELYQTEPGGLMEQCTFCAAGSNREAILSDLENVVAGLDRANSASTSTDMIVTGMLSALFKQDNPEITERKFDVWCLQYAPGNKVGGNIYCFKGVDEKSASFVAQRMKL